MTSLKRPSKITIPDRAHPLARLVFALMKQHNVSYDELEWRSGVLRSTFKAWRKDNTPGLATIEAALGTFGWALIPVPPIEALSAATRAKLAEIGLDFTSDKEAIAAALMRVCGDPRRRLRPDQVSLACDVTPIAALAA